MDLRALYSQLHIILQTRKMCVYILYYYLFQISHGKLYKLYFNRPIHFPIFDKKKLQNFKPLTLKKWQKRHKVKKCTFFSIQFK